MKMFNIWRVLTTIFYQTETTPTATATEMFVSDDRDREFEERRKKIEIEQDLIYQQEEQHFREVTFSILTRDVVEAINLCQIRHKLSEQK